MFLIYCVECGDVTPVLRDTLTICYCGVVRSKLGRDNYSLYWNGNGHILKFEDFSFNSQIRNQEQSGNIADGRGREFRAFILPDNHKQLRIGEVK